MIEFKAACMKEVLHTLGETNARRREEKKKENRDRVTGIMVKVIRPTYSEVTAVAKQQFNGRGSRRRRRRRWQQQQLRRRWFVFFFFFFTFQRVYLLNTLCAENRVAETFHALQINVYLLPAGWLAWSVDHWHGSSCCCCCCSSSTEYIHIGNGARYEL